MSRWLAACVVLPLLGCDAEPPSVPSGPGAPGDREPASLNDGASPEPGPSATIAEFTGGAACAGCHAAEARAWTGSHHDRAMQSPDAGSVLGDFQDGRFEHAGITTRFFERDGEYWVNTEGPDGELADFRIAYAFGVEPLQQYLIELPGGRLQALGIAWDDRPAALGGQRWFHLYPDQRLEADDPLHWTGVYQNWNAMCAECHSTGLEKNFSFSDGDYSTQWHSVDVDCEACHGPGSLHASAPSTYALALERVERAWALAPDADTAQRAPPPPPTRTELETCAQCHSRRTQLDEAFVPGAPYLDSFRPALLEAGLYHADGQILDEVYVYGSFLQSRMHAAGVTCSDCHEPHAATLRAEGNGLCTQCHRAAIFDGPEHHGHAPGTVGSECVSCHMPARTFMGIDPRRDHSFRVPRPDLSASLGTPNACNECHAEQTPAWAGATLERWGKSEPAEHFGAALAAGRSWHADRVPRLLALVDDEASPAIARATAISLLGAQPGETLLTVVERTLDRDAEPLLTLAALEQLSAVPEPYRVELAQRFLDAPLKTHRLAAARGLATLRETLGPSRRADLDAALEAYIEAQRFNADRPEGLVNLGALYTELGRYAEAEAVLTRAIDLVPSFAASYVNLAEAYRSQGRDNDARALLERATTIVPQDAAVAVALGFSLVRADDPARARRWLERAVELAPDEPYYAYVYGIALYSAGETETALEVLGRAQTAAPGYAELAYALATIHRDLGNTERALEYARRLRDAAPADPRGRALLDELSP